MEKKIVKPYTIKELNEMYEMRKNGASWEDIGEMFGRTASAVQVKFSAMGWSNDNNPRNKANGDAVPPQPEKKPAPVEQKKKPELSQFTPREMIKYLWGLGYRIENNQLVCITKTVVNVKAIVYDL